MLNLQDCGLSHEHMLYMSTFFELKALRKEAFGLTMIGVLSTIGIIFFISVYWFYCSNIERRYRSGFLKQLLITLCLIMVMTSLYVFTIRISNKKELISIKEKQLANEQRPEPKDIAICKLIVDSTI